VPPDFILDTTLTQLEQLSTESDQSVLLTSLHRRCQEFERAAARPARKVWNEKISPALEKQWGAVKQAREKAKHDAGVWHIKDGDVLVCDYLQISTTTKMTPDEIHKMGLEQAAEFPPDGCHPEAQGLTQGGIGARIKGSIARIISIPTMSPAEADDR